MAYDTADEASVAALDRIIGADPDNAGVRAQLQETIWASPKLLLTGIEEQAQTLGITDPGYLWIAARSLLSPLPEGWAQYKDQHGSPYYLNEKSGESRWAHPLDEHYVAMYRSYVPVIDEAPPTPRLGYEGPTPRGPPHAEENGRLVDSPERGRRGWEPAAPAEASADDDRRRREASSEGGGQRSRKKDEGSATVDGARRAAARTRRARRASDSSPEPRRGEGRSRGEAESPRSATEGEAGRLFALPSEKRAAAEGRVRSGLTSSSSSEEGPSRRQRSARAAATGRSARRQEEHAATSSEGEQVATVQAARRDARASSRAADDPNAILDRLDEALASDARNEKWTDRLLGVLELHAVFSEHDGRVRQATAKLKRNDRAVAEAERHADKAAQKLKLMKDGVDDELRRRGELERRLRAAEARTAAGDDDRVAALEAQLQKAEARAQRSVEELGRRVRRPHRADDSDQLADALRSIDDLEDKLAGALLAGEALQRECAALKDQAVPETDADLTRTRDEALDRVASLESALALSKAERDAAKAASADRGEEARTRHQRLLEAEGRCDALVAEKADETRRRRRDVDEARAEAFEAEQRCTTLKTQIQRLEAAHATTHDDARLKRLEKRAEELDAARAREAARADDALQREDGLRAARDAARAQAAAAEAAADARRADVQAIAITRDAAESLAEAKGAKDARKLRSELESVREANARFVEASRTRCERAEFHAAEAARGEAESRRDADVLREKCDALLEETRRLDSCLETKDAEHKELKRDVDECKGADLTAFAACARLWRVALQQKEVATHAVERMEADVLSARSVAEAEVMSARHDAERATKQREDALQEVSELRKRLADSRNRFDAAAASSLKDAAAADARGSKLEAQLANALARHASLADEVAAGEAKGVSLEAQLHEARARATTEAEKRTRAVDGLTNNLDEAAQARGAAESLRDEFERRCGEAEAEGDLLQTRLDQAEGDIHEAERRHGDAVAALRRDLESARAESTDVSAKQAKESADAVDALRLRLAQAETAKEQAVAELAERVVIESAQNTTLDQEQLKAEADLALALADSEALRTKLGAVGPSREELNEAKARARDCHERYQHERKLRRKLGDELAELRGNIRVVARCRPASGSSVVAFPAGADGALEVVNDRGLTQRFEFDRVFRPGSSQADVFDHVAPVVQGCFEGRHACIFAYGQTGSGKTHTMEGPPQDRGVIFRALSELFHGKPVDSELTVKLSMLEIYNEAYRDLLSSQRTKLEVKRTKDGRNEVYGLTIVDVASLEEVQRHVEAGSLLRHTGAHDLNDRSSRSHLILSLDVECKKKDETLTAKLNLVDLAGSERLSRTGATGDRLKEAQAINKSLSSLGDVVNALAKKTQCHVPYRNSKLTYLLQDSLSRAAKVLMVVNISPLEADASETICSLAFAARCRDVELGAALARPEAAELARAKQEIRALRSRLDRLALAAK